MSTRLQLCNRALLMTGVTQLIVDVTELTREAGVARELYRPAVREVLRAHEWGFATKYADSAQASSDAGMALFDGTVTDPVLSAEWTFAYRYPSDCLKARRFVGANGRRIDRNPPPFGRGRNSPQNEDDPSGDVVLIFSDLENPVLEYTGDVDLEITTFIEPLFENVLVTLLGSRFAASLARDPKLARELYLMALDALPLAKSVDTNERQVLQEPNEGPSWMADR